MFGGIRNGRLMPRPVALAILGVALLLRVMIPTGWMPSHGADGVTRITLCTGMGAVEAWVDAEGTVHDKKPVDKGGADQPCAFSGLAMLADLPVAAAEPLSARTAPQSGPAFPGTVSVGRGLAAPPPPSTGPPAFA